MSGIDYLSSRDNDTTSSTGVNGSVGYTYVQVDRYPTTTQEGMVFGDYSVAIGSDNVCEAPMRVWKKHISGAVIQIKDMSEEHLQATIAMLKRGYDANGNAIEEDRMRYLDMLEYEVLDRGLSPRKEKDDGWDA